MVSDLEYSSNICVTLYRKVGDTMKLSEFIDKWNNGGIVPLTSFEEFVIDYIGNECVDAFTTTYGVEPERKLSVSSLYKEIMLLGFDKFGYRQLRSTNMVGKFHLFFGKVLEALVLALMREYGVDVHSLQETVEFEGIPGDGHIDAVYQENTVLDIKSMGSYYFKSFTSQPDDDRGYVTQLLVYKYAKQKKYCGVLAVDKWFGTLAYVPIRDSTIVVRNNEEDEASLLLSRAAAVAECINELQTMDDVWELSLPQAIKHKAGKFLIPPNTMRYDTRSNVFFEMKKDRVVSSYPLETVQERIELYKDGKLEFQF